MSSPRPSAPAMFGSGSGSGGRGVLIALAVLLTLVILGSVGALLLLGDDDAASTSDPAASSTPGRDESQASPSTTEEPVVTEESDTGSDTAAELYSLIRESSRDKANIQAAARELTSCGDLRAAATVFDDAETSRYSLADRARALDLSALPAATALVDELARAWDFSARADAAFADAARFAPCDNASNELARATRLSSRSHPHKDRAARLWNEIAEEFGLPTVTGSQL